MLESQRKNILTLLQSKPVVSLPEILDMRIANHTARITELRKLGYNILCRTYIVKVGDKYQKHSNYSLIS